MSKWDGIDEFAAVAGAGSFSKGAEILGVSATHISRAVMALEQRLQVQLLHRTTRVVRLTDTGQAFLDHCHRLIEDREEAIGLVTEGSDPQGELRLTCSTAMGERFVAPIMRRFALANPQVSISIDLTNRIVDLVGEGYDLAIRTGALVDSRLIGTRIGSRSFLTCAAPEYLERFSPPASIEDLAEHECLVGTSSLWKFARGGEPVSYRPQGRFRCNSGQAVLEACLAGMGICQLPEFYALPSLTEGQLEFILPDHRTDEEPIWAIYPQRRHLSPKIRCAIDYLKIELPKAMQCDEN